MRIHEGCQPDKHVIKASKAGRHNPKSRWRGWGVVFPDGSMGLRENEDRARAAVKCVPGAVLVRATLVQVFDEPPKRGKRKG